jgi:hypothetical protein
LKRDSDVLLALTSVQERVIVLIPQATAITLAALNLETSDLASSDFVFLRFDLTRLPLKFDVPDSFAATLYSTAEDYLERCRLRASNGRFDIREHAELREHHRSRRIAI